MKMYDLRYADFNEKLIVKEINGNEDQIIYLNYIGIEVGKEITVLSKGFIDGTLLVTVNDNIYQLNSDAIKRIIVNTKNKIYQK